VLSVVILHILSQIIKNSDKYVHFRHSGIEAESKSNSNVIVALPRCTCHNPVNPQKSAARRSTVCLYNMARSWLTSHATTCSECIIITSTTTTKAMLLRFLPVHRDNAQPMIYRPTYKNFFLALASHSMDFMSLKLRSSLTANSAKARRIWRVRTREAYITCYIRYGTFILLRSMQPQQRNTSCIVSYWCRRWRLQPLYSQLCETLKYITHTLAITHDRLPVMVWYHTIRGCWKWRTWKFRTCNCRTENTELTDITLR